VMDDRPPVRRNRRVFWLAIFVHVIVPCSAEGPVVTEGRSINSTHDAHRTELWKWEALRPKRGVNFVRVPKTASTSFMMMLVENQLGGPDSKDYDCRHIPDPLANQGRGAQRSRCNHRKLRELRITHEKACAGPWIDSADAPQGRDRPAWVTILRNPVERVISEFIFLSSKLKSISWQNKYWAKRSWGWIISDEEEKTTSLHPAYAHIQSNDLLAFASERTNPAFTRQVRRAVRSKAKFPSVRRAPMQLDFLDLSVDRATVGEAPFAPAADLLDGIDLAIPMECVPRAALLRLVHACAGIAACASMAYTPSGGEPVCTYCNPMQRRWVRDCMSVRVRFRSKTSVPGVLCRYLLQGSTMLLDLVGIPPSEQNLQPITDPRWVRTGGQYERRKDTRVTELLSKHTKPERRLYKLAKARFEQRRGTLGHPMPALARAHFAAALSAPQLSHRIRP
jgi:hypothetical protein